jgi:hypothetical protein
VKPNRFRATATALVAGPALHIVLAMLASGPTRALAADDFATIVDPTGRFPGDVENVHSGHEMAGNVVLTTGDVASIQAELAELRQVTAAYHDINLALADGFQLGINGAVKVCVAHPTLGAMGYHYSRQDRFDDVTITELEPEVLVYHTAEDGSLELGAVEWVVPKAAWEATHGVGAPPPVVYGIALTVINPVLNWYVAHAWIWKPNPSGILMNWNPKVTCP